MMKRLRRLLAIFICLVAFVISVLVARWYYLERLTNPYLIDSSWPELSLVAVDENADAIVCGDNIHVSHEHTTARHYEVVIAAGKTPDSPVCIASMYNEGETHFVRAFVSLDDGKTWKSEYKMLPRRGANVDDPTIEIAADGTVYLVGMDTIDGGQRQGGLELVTREATTGEWSARSIFDSYLDRPWVTLANTETLFVIAQNDEASLFSFDLSDFKQTAKHSTEIGFVGCRPTRVLVWPNTKPLAIVENRNPIWNGLVRRTVPQIVRLKQTDRGDLEPQGKIGGEWQYSRGNPGTPPHTLFPAAACNADASQYAKHGYCVWGASLSSHPDDECVLVSRSTDQGETWETAQVLSEQNLTAKADERYLSFLPEVAVNKDGIVGALWYDRRGMAPCSTEEVGPKKIRFTHFVGQNVRFRASVDGGISWLPSIQVNSAETLAAYDAGHTLGISTDAKGRFHATWIDARTGVPQVWTAAICVSDHTKDAK